MSTGTTQTLDQIPLLGSDALQFDKPNLPNAAILMSSLRHLGYSNHAAVADLIDNSLDADAQNIAVEVTREKGDFVISVADDGIAMDDPTLDEAAKLGSDTARSVASDLGLYGMGLVTASVSIGRRLQVITRPADGVARVAISDLDEILAKNEFVKYQGLAKPDELTVFEATYRRNGLEVPATGTIVTISKSDGMQYTTTGHFVNSLKKHLAQTFRYYLAAGKRIRVNGEDLQPIDPLHLELDGVKVFSDEDYDFTFKDADGKEITEKVRVRLVTLPDFGTDGNKERGFTLKSQGFYILRNNREIAEAQTLGLFNRHSEFNLFRAEVLVPATMDDILGVNFTKREVRPKQAFTDKLRQVVGGQLKTIRAQRWKKRVKDERTDQHQEAARLITAKSHLLVKPKAEIERRGPRTKRTEVGRRDGKETGKERKNLRKTQLTPDDLRCRFEQVSLGEGGQIFEAYQEGRTIIVQWNVDHPFYQRFVTSSEADEGLITAVDFFIWAWASAELMVYEDANAEMLDQMKTLISMNTRTLLK
jgi:Histidine kinase-, DNA gyrase B-, and HSP90-like ATPase